MPNFISLLTVNAPLTGLRLGLLALYDFLLASSHIADAEKGQIARLRAQTDIILKPLN